MNPPHSTGLRTQTCLDPMKEVAWGARPRTVRAAALLGVRLNDRRPAPICMGGCAAQGVGLGGPSPVARTPGLGDCPPPPARPSRALACKQGVLGLGGRVGGGVGVRTPLPGHPWVFVRVRATSGGGGVPQRVRGCRSGLEGDGGGGSVPRRVMGPPRVVWVTGRVHPAFGQNASTTTTSWSMPSRAIAARPAWSTGWRLSRASMETAERAEDRIPVTSRTF